MAAGSFASWVLAQEARALLTRLERVKSFAMAETMVPAAALSVEAQAAIEAYLLKGRRELRTQVREFLAWLETPQGRQAPPSEGQKRFTFLRLRFNVVLSQFDIFSEALSQRSEVDNGIWLAGLDVVSRDALELPGYYEVPPVLCYLARGPGAAIRRARTRLPGGGQSPVAIIRVPRERMVGSGIASSLIHEVGHQGAALLSLVPSLRQALQQSAPEQGEDAKRAWELWGRWISEIIADFWSVARVGVTSTLGLMGVVSLPRPFVFRLNAEDPHPVPWIRVKLSSAMGQALYPHPQWERLARTWEQFYPIEGLDPERRRALAELEASIPRLVRLLVEHRPASLQGRTLAEVMETQARQPARLTALYREWRSRRRRVRDARPSLVFAGIGQARADGAISPEEEARAMAELLKYWALRSTVDASVVCASASRARTSAAAVRPPALPINSSITRGG
ncbi:hypothetical protein [Myxococcus sp. RHSTA-1-4]|uniref:hypothetical protein n=1 Tax=Myxococcus sp. RHSTA-1-4 TaxID=2874601 RepID=UPI001CBC8C94|nr:hypothetical protein [Myxococcus sp. RHSTA-1-4]MBZ4422183.1 hypothetical protein [Myxococcus sp. RHSTA-1-4]